MRDLERAEYDEMVYERRAALLELECVNARRNVFDVEEVLEENQKLREQLAILAADRRLAAATEAERADEARRDMAKHKIHLEEELRKKWRMSEHELRQEALDALTVRGVVRVCGPFPFFFFFFPLFLFFLF